MSNINLGLNHPEKHSIPVDSFRQPILAAKSVMTRTKALTGIGTKDEIQVPRGCYEVNIKGTAKFYEANTAYTENNKQADGSLTENTYGSGYSFTNATFPLYNQGQFWLEGTGTVELLFSSIREV